MPRGLGVPHARMPHRDDGGDDWRSPLCADRRAAETIYLLTTMKEPVKANGMAKTTKQLGKLLPLRNTNWCSHGRRGADSGT